MGGLAPGIEPTNPSKLSDFLSFQRKVLDAFNSYQLPIIKLTKETPKEAVCLVFEKLNV